MLRFSVQHCTVINPCAVLNKKIINTSWKRTRGTCWLVKPLSEVSYWKKMMATWVNCYIMHLILTILNLMTEHKYTKVYTKACILNNSVYAVIKARTHIYIYGVYGWKVTSLHFVNMILAQKWSPKDPLRCVTFHKYTAKNRSTLAHFITWYIKI